MVKFSTDVKWYREFRAQVALRPAMYLGNSKDFGGLFRDILSTLIFYSKNDIVTIEVVIVNSKTYTINTNSKFEREKSGDTIIPLLDFYPLYLLCATSSTSKVSIFEGGNSKHLIFENGDNVIGNKGVADQHREGIEIQFELDENIYEMLPDYFQLSEVCYELATLDKRTSISVSDSSGAFVNQNYYHFPQGLRYILERIRIKGHRTFEVVFIDEQVGGNQYQIGIACQKWAYDLARVSYAGYNRTIKGGSLEKGILSGMLDARRRYLKTDPALEEHRFSRDNFISRLITVCQVISSDNTYDYCGSIKDELNDKEVNKEVRKLVREIVWSVFINDPNLAMNVCGKVA